MNEQQHRLNHKGILVVENGTLSACVPPVACQPFAERRKRSLRSKPTRARTGASGASWRDGPRVTLLRTLSDAQRLSLRSGTTRTRDSSALRISALLRVFTYVLGIIRHPCERYGPNRRAHSAARHDAQGCLHRPPSAIQGHIARSTKLPDVLWINPPQLVIPPANSAASMHLTSSTRLRILVQMFL